MTELEKKVNELNKLIVKGDSIKAMELFYAENVTMQENEEKPRDGKKLCLKHEAENIKKVKQLESKLLSQVIDSSKNIVFSEWEITFITMNNKKLKLNEVSVQYWNKGQVNKEKFYYKDFKLIF